MIFMAMLRRVKLLHSLWEGAGLSRPNQVLVSFSELLFNKGVMIIEREDDAADNGNGEVAE